MLKINIFIFSFFSLVWFIYLIDFFLKKICEIFVRNFFIYTAQFFEEKYVIECLIKEIIDSLIFNINRAIGVRELFFVYYLIQLISLFYI